MEERTPRVDWAGLLKRTFDFEVFACVRCGGRRRVLAYPKGLHHFSTRLAHCSGGPHQQPSAAPPLLPSPSTWPLSCL